MPERRCPAGRVLCHQTGIGGFVVCHAHRQDVCRPHHTDGTSCTRRLEDCERRKPDRPPFGRMCAGCHGDAVNIGPNIKGEAKYVHVRDRSVPTNWNCMGVPERRKANTEADLPGRQWMIEHEESVQATIQEWYPMPPVHSLGGNYPLWRLNHSSTLTPRAFFTEEGLRDRVQGLLTCEESVQAKLDRAVEALEAALREIKDPAPPRPGEGR